MNPGLSVQILLCLVTTSMSIISCDMFCLKVYLGYFSSPKLFSNASQIATVYDKWVSIRNCIRRSAHLGVFTGEEALLESTVHGQGDEHQEPLISQKPERGQEGAAELLAAFVLPKLPCCFSVNVVEENRHEEHPQSSHTYRGIAGTAEFYTLWLLRRIQQCCVEKLILGW